MDTLENRPHTVEDRKRLTPAQKMRLCYEQEYKCFTCEILIPPTAQVDHHIPLHKGGKNDWENLVALCPDCHSEKTQLEAIEREAKKRELNRGMSPYFLHVEETPMHEIPWYVLKRQLKLDLERSRKNQNSL